MKERFGVEVDRVSGPRRTIDLRSDTVTKPTRAMYERMVSAPLGDDGLDGDPTVRELENLAARIVGKQSGLFVPSCSMANLIAVLACSPRNSQVLLESGSHMCSAERGGATLAGCFYLPIEGVKGEMDLDRLETALQGNSSRIPTAMIGMETSHNNAGGVALPLHHMRQVRDLGRQYGAHVHLDGARMFNAAVALGLEPRELAACCDSVSLCLSKGLSAPFGALLMGEMAMIEKARSFRRFLGGQLRQAGVMAAAGIEALVTMPGRLVQDHDRARHLADLLAKGAPMLECHWPQTNILMVDVSRSGWTAEQWTKSLAEAGLLVRPWRENRVRCVVHRHIDDKIIVEAADIFRKASQKLAC